MISTTNLILNCILYVGLKYLWNMVNLLQFEVFMILWQIRIPYKAEAFLKYIKLLALMEFIPSQWFIDSISETLGISCQENDQICDDEEEKQGIEKLGTSNIIENMGIMLFLLSFIIILLGLVLVSRICMYKDYRWYRRYMKIRQKFFWNIFIRYILQSELKLLVSACSVLFLGLK